MSNRSLQRCAAFALAIVALGTTGCGGPAQAPTAASESSADAPAAVDPSTIELTSVDRNAFDAAVADQHGKVVLVDFWATWCTPCLAQLPHTAELARTHADAGLKVFTVSVDEPEDLAAVQKQLAKRVENDGAAGVTHFISALGGGSAAMGAFEITSGSVPHYKLYDRAGKLRKVFEIDPSAERPFTPDDIDAAVAELLAEPAA